MALVSTDQAATVRLGTTVPRQLVGRLMADDSQEISLGGRIRLGAVAWVFAIAACFVAAFLDIGFWISMTLFTTLTGFALLFWVQYFRGSIKSYTQTRRDNRGLPKFAVNKEFFDSVAELRISELQASTFLQMLDPQSGRIERISESVEQHVRSVTINTSLTVRLPGLPRPSPTKELKSDDVQDMRTADASSHGGAFHDNLILPLVLHGRGRLLDNFKVYDANEKRISTLTNQDALAWQVAIIRKFVHDGIGSENLKKHYGPIEARIIDILSKNDYSNADDAEAVESSLIALSVQYGDTRRLLLVAARIVRALSEYYAGCILVSMNSKPTYSKFTFERREIPLVVTLKSSKGRVRRWFSPENLRDGFRELLGVRPSSVQHPLSYIDRARSYHVQVKGPDGTYLGRQRIVDSRTGKTVPLHNKAMRARLGQRYSHLYVRNSWRGTQLYYECTFYERPPGSVAVSAMSSVAATFLIALVALSSMGMTSVVFGAAVTTLLAVPAAIGAWSGLDQSRTMIGGVLAARFSALITIGATFLAILIFSLTPHTPFGTDLAISERSGYAWWVVAFSVSVLNALATTGSWSLRTIVYRHFVERRR